MQQPNQRVLYLDLLRVIATIAVIFLHVSASELLSLSFSVDWYIALVYDSVVRWSVPVFVMISGALFLNPDKEITYLGVLKKQIPRLLLAYVFWTLVYVMYGFILTDFEGFSVSHVIRRAIVSPRVHLWFLPMLMGVYLLIPVLRKIAQDKQLLRYALIIWLVYVFISFLQFVEMFHSAEHFYSLFNMNSIVGFSGYFLLGYFLSQQDFSKKQRICIYLLGIVGALVTIFGTYYVSISSGEVNERYFANLSLQVIAMASALFVLVKQRAPKCRKLVRGFVNFVRKDLFGIYLIHLLWFPLVNTATIRHCCSGIITLPLITIIVFLLSLLVTKLIRLIPVFRKVVE